jgi:hypothetical protein
MSKQDLQPLLFPLYNAVALALGQSEKNQLWEQKCFASKQNKQQKKRVIQNM